MIKKTVDPSHRAARLAFCLLLIALVACSSTRPVGEQMTDAAITAKVKSKLTADPEINPFNIDVDTANGIVRLSGRVEDLATRAEAEQLALDTGGVRGVVNEISVGERKMGERVSDAALIAKIKTKLSADPEINPFNIDVDVEDGVVTLSGTVAKSQARAEAEKLALGTKGVRKVVNRIEVE